MTDDNPTPARPYDAIERLNDQIAGAWAKHRDRFLGEGLPPDDAEDAANNELADRQTEFAPKFADELMTDFRAGSAEMTQYTAGFRERLTETWGDAFELYDAIIGIIQTYSGATIARAASSTGQTRDPLFDILAQLNGHAIRVAREIHALMTAGYPLGALALARTIYEIAVRATIISEWGRHPDHLDLPERFLEHHHVINQADALIYERDAAQLGFEPLGKAVVERVRAEHQRVTAKYSDVAFKESYGWTIGLPGITHGRDFTMLEKLAETSHRRGLYKWSSHLIHLDAKGLRLGQVTRGNSTTTLIGPTNNGFADPADHAMYGLHLTFIAFANGAPDGLAFVDEFIVRAIASLVERTQEALVAAEESIDDAEERLQAELAETNQRMTPHGIADL